MGEGEGKKGGQGGKREGVDGMEQVKDGDKGTWSQPDEKISKREERSGLDMSD